MITTTTIINMTLKRRDIHNSPKCGSKFLFNTSSIPLTNTGATTSYSCHHSWHLMFLPPAQRYWMGTGVLLIIGMASFIFYHHCNTGSIQPPPRTVRTVLQRMHPHPFLLHRPIHPRDRSSWVFITNNTNAYCNSAVLLSESARTPSLAACAS